MKNKIKKQDIILIAVLLSAAAIFSTFRFWASQRPVKVAEILVEGQVIEVLSLEEDSEILIHGYKGGTNHLIVKDGEIWCDEATCPDKICVHTGKISLSTETIACLPNKMIVRIKGD